MSKLSQYPDVKDVQDVDSWPVIFSGDNAKVTTHQLAKAVGQTVDDIYVPSMTFTPSGLVQTTNVEVTAAVALLASRGGGTVRLSNGTYNFLASVTLVPGVRIVGQTPGGVGTDANGVGSSVIPYGTVIRGANTTIDLFVAKNVPGVANFATLGDFLSDCVVGIGLENMHLDNCRRGISIGEKWTGGPFYSIFRNICVTGYSDWGIWINNFGSIVCDNMLAVPRSGPERSAIGGIYFGALQGSVYNTGNSEFRSIFTDPGPVPNSRGIVFQVRYNSRMNHINVFQIQCNQGGTRKTRTFTSDGVTADLTLTTPANILDYPLEMPIMFTVANGNIEQDTLYFVTANDGVSKIRVAKFVGSTNDTGPGWNYSTNFTTPGVAFSYTGVTQGWANIEVVSNGHNLAAFGVQSFTMAGADLEALAPTCMLIQYAAGDYTFAINEVDNNSTLVGTVCGRNFQGSIAGQSMTFDFDPASYGFSTVKFAGDWSDANQDNLFKNFFLSGSFYGRAAQTRGINIAGGSANGLSGSWINSNGKPYLPNQLSGDNILSGSGIRANVPISFRLKHSTTLTETYFNGGTCFWHHVYNGGGAGTRTLVPYDGSGDFFTGFGGIGQKVQFSNPTTFKLTINAGAGNNFNFDSSQTVMYVQPGGFLELTLGWNGSANSWVVTGSRNVNSNKAATGTFTPAATGVANITTVSNGTMIFSQSENIVNCKGRLTVQPTTAGVSTTFRLTLPVTTDITLVDQAYGLGVIHADPQGGSGSNLVQIDGNLSPDAVLFTFLPDSNGAGQVINYDFSYQIKG